MRAMAGAAAELAGSAAAWLLRSGSTASHAGGGAAFGAYLRAGVWLLLASGVLAGTLQLLLVAMRTAGVLVLLAATQAEALLLAALLAGATAALAARPWRRGGPLSPRALRDALARAGGAQRVLGVALMAAGAAIVLVSALQFQPLAPSLSGDASDDRAPLAFSLAAYCAAAPPGRGPHHARGRGRGAAGVDGPAPPTAASLSVSAVRFSARVACNLLLPAEMRFVFLPLAAGAPVLALPALACAGAMLAARIWLFATYAFAAAAVTAAWAGCMPATRAASGSAGAATPACPPPPLIVATQRQAQTRCMAAPPARAAPAASRPGSLLLVRLPVELLSAAAGAPRALVAVPRLLLCAWLAALRRGAIVPAAAAVSWWLGLLAWAIGACAAWVAALLTPQLAAARSAACTLLWCARAAAWPLFAYFSLCRTLLRCASAVAALRPALLSRAAARTRTASITGF
ncbi:hypothetical protein Rsub_04463 [Raphidocelis subcapitata]|uniref:Uncharacterized protein n=1 Tax=Raphidocelis subcapitata TaxID=307507 RepID=A0A2V0NWW6_9CHLO|nr:hypothetical protein Rsub_04463 [Raphidocelis subcapitata]|eukprot:GBF92116.1 hypothetical protein Rsub_04463 [Raphidocelis subcapitata]